MRQLLRAILALLIGFGAISHVADGEVLSAAMVFLISFFVWPRRKSISLPSFFAALIGIAALDQWLKQDESAWFTTILAFLFFAWSWRRSSAGTNRAVTRLGDQSSHTYKRTPISKGLRWKVFVRDNFTCQYCGRTPKKHGVTLEIDHKIPVSKGGTNELDNLVTSCSDCNRGKGASAYFG